MGAVQDEINDYEEKFPVCSPFYRSIFRPVEDHGGTGYGQGIDSGDGFFRYPDQSVSEGSARFLEQIQDCGWQMIFWDRKAALGRRNGRNDGLA